MALVRPTSDRSLCRLGREPESAFVAVCIGYQRGLSGRAPRRYPLDSTLEAVPAGYGPLRNTAATEGAMDYPVEHDDFSGRNLIVRLAGFFGSAKLLEGGTQIAKFRGSFSLRDSG